MEKSPAQHLCDVFHALAIQIKYMETLIDEHKKDARTDEDFCMRFENQSELLCRNLKQIKPASEALIKEGYGRIEDARSKRADSKSEIQSGESEGLGDEPLVQNQES